MTQTVGFLAFFKVESIPELFDLGNILLFHILKLKQLNTHEVQGSSDISSAGGALHISLGSRTMINLDTLLNPQPHLHTEKK